MKFAFSTIGCPDWTFNEIISAAVDLSFDAVEIRGIEKEVFAPFAKPFLGTDIDKTIAFLHRKNIEIAMLTTGVVLSGNRNNAISEATAYIDLAEKLKTPYIRVMITDKPIPEEADMDLALDTYKKICIYAKDKNVIPLVETNGILADSSKMKEFIEKVDNKNCGVLWDIHHPYRFFNETPQQTVANIGKYVKYVHVKDSIIENGKVIYKIMGNGDVPIISAIKCLSDIGYNSYISLEWVKRWYPELDEAGIVFSHFSDYCKSNLKDIQ